MDKNDLYELFKSKLDYFVRDLQAVIGHLPQYKLLPVVLTVSTKEQVQAWFDAHIAQPYGASIIAEDEAFFLSRDYRSYVSGATGAPPEDGLGILPLIKGVWASMTPHDRKSVWTHLQHLLTINKRILSLP